MDGWRRKRESDRSCANTSGSIGGVASVARMEVVLEEENDDMSEEEDFVRVSDGGREGGDAVGMIRSGITLFEFLPSDFRSVEGDEEGDEEREGEGAETTCECEYGVTIISLCEMNSFLIIISSSPPSCSVLFGEW